MAEWVLIGVPSSAGAHHAGQELAPEALRRAGLIERLNAAGESVTDAGDLPGAVFAVDHAHPGARNLPAVATVARQVADAVAGLAAGPALPLIVGGDCTITLGAIAGLRRRDADIGLIYIDGDTDVNVPGTDDPSSDSSGIFDSMGISHLLGRGAPELTGLAGTVPLLDPARLALVGADPRETGGGGRKFLAQTGVSFAEAPALIADPAATAAAALAAVTPASGPILIHFDVDVVDSGDLPLGNFPHYGSGVRLEHVIACLRVLRAAPSFAGLVLTEVNPTHDPRGELLTRYIDGVVTALTT